jgi:hypothetical protein
MRWHLLGLLAPDLQSPAFSGRDERADPEPKESRRPGLIKLRTRSNRVLKIRCGRCSCWRCCTLLLYAPGGRPR